MPNKKCLSFHRMQKYADNGYGAQERACIEKHFEMCQRCLKRYECLLDLKKVSEKKKSAIDEIPFEFFELQEKFFGDAEDELTRKKFMQYITNNPACFAELAKTIKDSAEAPTREELEEFATYDKRAGKDSLEDFEQAFFFGENKKPQKSNVKSDCLTYKSRNFFSFKWKSLNSSIAFSAILIALTVYQHYGQSALLQDARIARTQHVSSLFATTDDFRLAGGVRFSPIGQTRSIMQNSTGKKYTPIFRALEENPQKTELNHFAGSLYLSNAQLDSAEIYLRKAIQLDKTNAAAYNDLAALAGQRKDYAKAVEYLQNAIDSKPEMEEPCYNMALTYEMAGEIEAAITAWQNYLEKFADSESDWFKVAQSRMKRLQK